MAKPKFQESKQKFTEDLIAAREYRDMDINRVSEKTKISVDYLKRLEAGDWDFLPHSYVRAFLRTYAQIVGMDVGEVLERFDRIVGVPSTPTAPAVKPGEKPRKPKEAAAGGQPKFTLAEDSAPNPLFDPENRKYLYIGGGVLVLILVVVLLFTLLGGEDKGEQEAVGEIPFDEVISETEGLDTSEADTLTGTAGQGNTDVDLPGDPVDDGSESTQAGRQPAVGGQAGQALNLMAVAEQACYLRVIPDSNESRVVDTILSGGSSRTFTADSLFRVVIGNTRGVNLTLNGKRLTGLEQRGRVVTVTIGRGGVRQIQAGNKELHPTAGEDSTAQG